MAAPDLLLALHMSQCGSLSEDSEDTKKNQDGLW
jgi:hypothetical protein